MVNPYDLKITKNFIYIFIVSGCLLNTLQPSCKPLPSRASRGFGYTTAVQRYSLGLGFGLGQNIGAHTKHIITKLITTKFIKIKLIKIKLIKKKLIKQQNLSKFVSRKMFF